ncbi:MAG TPA: hypothetical protein VMR29_01280, partial [Candidatus Binatia bacterium]|nr:hypothetical protein [Candidatus Binatia bacterium]
RRIGDRILEPSTDISSSVLPPQRTFYEYFHADTGRGVGASHQTGWTALVVRALEDLARARS